MLARPISGSPPPQPATASARPRTRGFDAALARAVGAGSRAAIGTRSARPGEEAQPPTSSAPSGLLQPQTTLPAESPRATAPVAEARLAADAIALRDRGALELRFGAEAVRLEVVPSGVELRVDAGPRAAQGVLDPAALADAVRARGVPVAEPRRGGERRDRRRR